MLICGSNEKTGYTTAKETAEERHSVRAEKWLLRKGKSTICARKMTGPMIESENAISAGANPKPAPPLVAARTGYISSKIMAWNDMHLSLFSSSL